MGAERLLDRVRVPEARIGPALGRRVVEEIGREGRSVPECGHAHGLPAGSLGLQGRGGGPLQAGLGLAGDHLGDAQLPLDGEHEFRVADPLRVRAHLAQVGDGFVDPPRVDEIDGEHVQEVHAPVLGARQVTQGVQLGKQRAQDLTSFFDGPAQPARDVLRIADRTHRRDRVAGRAVGIGGQGRDPRAHLVIVDRQGLAGVGVQDVGPLVGTEVLGHVVDGAPIRSNASRWRETRATSAAATSADSCASRRMPARSKWAEAWISDWPMSLAPNVPARPW